MGPRRHGRGWGIAIGAIALAAGAWLAIGTGEAFAGKPPPPPPPPTTGGRMIYFQFSGDPNAWRMTADGATREKLAGTWGNYFAQFAVSRETYGGSLWQARTVYVAGPYCPDGSAPQAISVGALEYAAEALVLSDPNYKVGHVDFRPSSGTEGPRLSFEGVHWTGTSIEAGLFQLSLTTDADGRITGAASSGPVLLFNTGYQGDPQGRLWPNIRPHTWISADRLAYGENPVNAAGTFVGGALRVHTFGMDVTSPVLSTETARAWFVIAASPDGTRLSYTNYGGIYEVPVAGGPVTCWVATKSTRKGEVRPEAPDYVDNDTIAYSLHDINTMGGTLSTATLYRKSRSGTTVQLTKSTEPYAQMVKAR